MDYLPSARIFHDMFQCFSNLQLTDESFYLLGKIDYLIGVDLYSQILPDKPHSFPKASAVETAFGWIILGPIDKPINNLVNATSLLTSIVFLMT